MIKNSVAAAGFTLMTAFSAAQAQDWSGFYGGVIAGSLPFSATITDGGFSPDYADTQFLAGALVGYNVQRGNFVFGAEADYQFGFGIDQVQASDIENYVFAGIQSVGTLRGRAGVTTGNVMFYATAGLAFGTLMTAQRADFASVPYEEATVSASGFVYGAGVEAMLGNGWSARGEYRVYSFGDSETFTFTGSYTERTLNDISANVIEVMLIKHF